jgi:hypothetical protein
MHSFKAFFPFPNIAKDFDRGCPHGKEHNAAQSSDRKVIHKMKLDIYVFGFSFCSTAVILPCFLSGYLIANVDAVSLTLIRFWGNFV